MRRLVLVQEETVLSPSLFPMISLVTKVKITFRMRENLILLDQEKLAFDILTILASEGALNCEQKQETAFESRINLEKHINIFF